MKPRQDAEDPAGHATCPACARLAFLRVALGILAAPRAIPTELSPSPMYGIVWTGAQFVAVGANSTVIRSWDGVAWDVVTYADPSHPYLYGVAWSGARLVAVGQAILTSE